MPLHCFLPRGETWNPRGSPLLTPKTCTRSKRRKQRVAKVLLPWYVYAIGNRKKNLPERMAMTNAADIIKILHAAFVILNVVAPFSDSQDLLRYHVVVMPFLYLHWITNDDTCALTLLETHLRGCPNRESFFHNLVSPVYKFRATTIVWLFSLALWIVSMVRYFA